MIAQSYTGKPSAVRNSGPFDLENDGAYRKWRDWKLTGYPATAEDLVIEVNDPRRLSRTEHEELLRICRKTNMAIYTSRLGAEADKEIPRRLGQQFGLRRLDPNMLADDDGITSLAVVPGKLQRGYIPYSNRRLLWHTDGYYNKEEQRIRAVILHCVTPAARGGENQLLDPELVYIKLRDQNPVHVAALMEPDAMTIPANTEEGIETRAAQSGPVFYVDEAGNLQMRYTARTRSILWKNDEQTREALVALEALLGADSPFVFAHRMESGQGLLSNNVLHNRSGFEDATGEGPQRLVYRARYYDRIAGTGLHDFHQLTD
jgi:hypothetical protein